MNGFISDGNIDLNYLPLSGGTMGGTIKFGVQMALVRNTNNSRLEIAGGTSSSYGASIYLDGVDRAYTPGSFGMTARNAEGTAKSFLGNASGNLTWDGKEIERVNSSGSNYIRYESGLQICWGVTDAVKNGDAIVTLPVAFTNNNFKLSVDQKSSSNTTTMWTVFVRGSLSNTAFTVYSNAGTTFHWFAIGLWK